MCCQDTPEFSVVVASFSGPQVLRQCLQSLEPQCAGGEIIVATNVPRADLADLRGAVPDVRFVLGDRSSTVFQLRSLGISAARGGWIALTEDHCIPEREWISSLKSAIAQGRTIIAGPVLPGDESRWTDRALFLCEYANLLPPLRSEQLAFVSGVNAAYPRAALQGCRCVWRDGFYENEVSDALLAAGYTFDVAQEAAVRSRISMSLGNALAHFFVGGRRFGQYRSARLTNAARVGRLAIAPLVPPVLLARILRLAVARMPGGGFALLAAVPAVASLMLAWSLGEFAGHCRGTAQASSRGAHPSPSGRIERSKAST
jgi:hypothetical protein